MEILETLLFVCHAHIKKTNSLNNFLLNSSFVASYLQSVLKVLESGELDLQLDAALAVGIYCYFDYKCIVKLLTFIGLITACTVFR